MMSTKEELIKRYMDLITACNDSAVPFKNVKGIAENTWEIENGMTIAKVGNA